VAQEEAALNQPVNDLERERDADQKWRRATNNMVRDHYQPLYGLFDRWVYRKPPSWDAVCQWSQRDNEVWLKRMSDRGVEVSEEQRQGGEIFSQLSQRFALESVARLSRKSDYVLTLDADRRITSFARTRND
jgi:D-glycerate 3-kinase